MNLKTFGDALVGQHRAHGGMPDFGHRVYQFDLGIDDTGAVLEKRRQAAERDVAIFVDGQAEHRAAMLAEPCRIIGPAAKQRDTKRRATDDHAGRTPLTLARLWSTRPV